MAKYSYKKLSQNEAEFIPEEECPEYKAPIIKKNIGRHCQSERLANGNTDVEQARDDTFEDTRADTDTCDDSGISCSEVTAHSLDIVPDYNFTVQFPPSLREEDCDWGKV